MKTTEPTVTIGAVDHFAAWLVYLHGWSQRLVDMTAVSSHGQRLVVAQALASAHRKAVRTMRVWAGVSEDEAMFMVAMAVDELTRRVARGQDPDDVELVIEQVRDQFERK